MSEITPLLEALVKQGLLTTTDVQVTPLTGGVSCEILLVQEGNTRLVLKRALAKLKVKDDWFADVNRNKIEQLYLRYVGEFMPESVPAIYYSDDELNFFCMEMLDGDFQNWKSLLLSGEYVDAYTVAAARSLGRIHAESAGDADVAAQFDTLDNFSQLRLEPYLLTTGERNPELNALFKAEAKRIAETTTCLIHGDYSPKNILVSPSRIAILDCEVAWYGDPVFDLAFMLNHFILKAVHLPEDSARLLQQVMLAWQAYTEAAADVVDAAYESRLCHLLPMLMLARVDGKSPVEYLTVTQKAQVRAITYEALTQTKPNTLTALLAQVANAISG